MTVIAEVEFDLAYSDAKMALRIFQPIKVPEFDSWICSFEIDDPIDVQRDIGGGSSLHALVLALKTASAYLYGSDFYKDQQIGLHGQFGGRLTIPATEMFLDVAPYPF